MGNITSISNLEVAQPLGPEWVKESRESYCAVLRNTRTGQQAEQYVLSIGDSIPAEFGRYDYRMHQNENLVSTWAVQHVGDEGVCNGGHKLLVTNERIPLRLSEVSGINFQDSITVIYSALIGFHAIHEVEGYVTVTDEMIGFTPDHRVKVWLNENFSENHPALQHRMVNQQYSASTMIEEIIALTEEHSAEPLLANFRNHFKSRFSPTASFGTALAIVRDYALANGLAITNKMTFAEGAPRSVATGQRTTTYVYPNVQKAERHTLIQEGQNTVTYVTDPPIVSYVQQPAQVHVQEPAVQATPVSFVAPVVAAPVIIPQPEILTSAPRIEQRTLARSTHFGAPIVNEISSVRRTVSPQDIPVVTRVSPPVPQNFVTTSTIDNINIKPISLATRDIQPVTTIPITSSPVVKVDAKIQKGTNLLEAERFLDGLKKPQTARISPVRNPTPTRLVNNQTETLFEKRSQTNIPHTQGVVIENSAFGHNIGRTLGKYGSNGVSVVGVVPKVATISPQVRPPQPPQPPQPKPPAGLFPHPVYVTPKVQINQTRTVNIDGIATSNLEQSQQIFSLNEPKTPIQGLPDHRNRGVVEGLQDAIKEMGDISVSGSNQKQGTLINSVLSEKKEYDLIEQMKTQLGATETVVEEKHMTHSFGQRQEGGSEHLLSQDVRDLLRNYDNNGAAYTSGYAINSQYKSSIFKVDDPIIIFNQASYNRVETKGEYTTSKYETNKYEPSNRYDQVTYSKPSDDYEALKAKYDIKYDTKDYESKYNTGLETNYGFADYQTKYESKREAVTYSNRNQDYGATRKYEENKTGSNKDLGESRYLKDYTSDQYNQDDPLIVFNTKKSDLGARDSLGYKTSITSKGGDYDEYRKYLKSSGDNNYNKYESNYDDGYSSRFGTKNQIEYERADRNQATYGTYGDGGYGNSKYGREENKYDRYSNNDRQNRYKNNKYETTTNRYDGGSSKYSNKEDRNGKYDRQDNRYDNKNRHDKQDRYDRQDRYERQERYAKNADREPSYQREERYESSRYERRNDKGRNADRGDRVDRADRQKDNRTAHYEKTYDNYERKTGRDGKEAVRERRESHQQNRHIQYNDLQSLLYD